MVDRVRDTPVSMHSHVPVTFDQPGDRGQTDEAIKYFNGTMEWTHRFTRYMQGVRPRELEEVLGHWREWWQDEYVVGRLRVRMGALQADAAIAVASRSESYHEVAKKTRHSVPWVDRQRRIAYRIVRENYHRYSRPRRIGAVVEQPSPGTAPTPPGNE